MVLGLKAYIKLKLKMEPPTGVKPATYRLQGDCSIGMSYRGKNGRPERGRTFDFLLVGQALYTTELQAYMGEVVGIAPTLTVLCTLFGQLHLPCNGGGRGIHVFLLKRRSLFLFLDL